MAVVVVSITAANTVIVQRVKRAVVAVAVAAKNTAVEVTARRKITAVTVLVKLKEKVKKVPEEKNIYQKVKQQMEYLMVSTFLVTYFISIKYEFIFL